MLTLNHAKVFLQYNPSIMLYDVNNKPLSTLLNNHHNQPLQSYFIFFTTYPSIKLNVVHNQPPQSYLKI